MSELVLHATVGIERFRLGQLSDTNSTIDNQVNGHLGGSTNERLHGVRPVNGVTVASPGMVSEWASARRM